MLFFLLAVVGASYENWNENLALGAMFGAKAKLTTSYTMQQK